MRRWERLFLEEFPNLPAELSNQLRTFISQKCLMEGPKMDPKIRFWKSVVNSDDCWNWIAGKNDKGYGVFWFDGKNSTAHRFSYEIHLGEIPKGMFVCHSCDTPHCVNPAHLFLGTNRDNVADKCAKGRQARGLAISLNRRLPRGENSPNSKLTASDIVAIRASTGISQADLAKRFGVVQSQISAIRRGASWSHL